MEWRPFNRRGGLPGSRFFHFFYHRGRGLGSGFRGRLVMFLALNHPFVPRLDRPPEFTQLVRALVRFERRIFPQGF